MNGKDFQELNDLIETLRLENKALSRKAAQLETIVERNRVIQAAKLNVSRILAGDRSRLEKYMNMMLDKNPEITLLFDSENRLAYCTEAFIKKANLRNFGLIENKTFREIFSALIDEEKLSMIEDRFNDALIKKLPISFEIDLDIERDDLRNYKILFTPMLGEFDEIEGAMALFHDTTDIVNAKEKALMASKAKTNFLANMSHEMRTPLNVIMGMSNIAMSTDEVSKKDYCLNKINIASAHLLSVINDILDMSKIETGRYELSENDFDLHEAIQKAIGALRFRIEEKAHSLTVNMSPDLPRSVRADEQRLVQVLTNLLSNAIKFTNNRGNIALCARTVSINNGQSLIEFRIEDDGIGISEEQQKNLFHSFEQADGSISRRFDGTGLGLAISKRIIERMGGEIHVDSTLGIGSAFTFTVIVKTESLATDAIDNTDCSATDGLSNLDFNGKRVLVAEDIDINREIVQTLLEEMNISVDFAVDGISALKMFIEDCENVNVEKYGMIFMDIHMPEMDGYDATRRIRALGYPRSKSIPIVAMTANVFREDIERCIDSGMNGHIGKPLNFNEVVNVLRKVLT